MRRNFELNLNSERNGFEVIFKKEDAKTEAELSGYGLRWDRQHTKMYCSPKVMEEPEFREAFANTKTCLRADNKFDDDFEAIVKSAYAAPAAKASKAAGDSKAKTKTPPEKWSNEVLLKAIIRRLAFADRDLLLQVEAITAAQEKPEQ